MKIRTKRRNLVISETLDKRIIRYARSVGLTDIEFIKHVLVNATKSMVIEYPRKVRPELEEKLEKIANRKPIASFTSMEEFRKWNNELHD